MKPLRMLLFASLAATFALPASGQNAVSPDVARLATAAGPMVLVSDEGFNLSAGAPTAPLDLVDVHPSSAFIIEGPVRMAMEGFAVFVVDCAVYSGDRIIARYRRGAPVLDGPFEGRFRLGLVRTAAGEPSGYACWANAYGNSGGTNWRAYEVPNATVPGGQVQFVKFEDGRFWDGGVITEQVVLHFSGLISGGVAQPSGPSANGLRRGLRVPDGSDVQWRPPIIPPLYGAQIAASREGRGGGDWASASDYLRGGDNTGTFCGPGCIPGRPGPSPGPSTTPPQLPSEPQ